VVCDVQNAAAIIFVADSTDVDRREDSCDHFQRMLEDPEIAGVPILLYANKQDLPSAVPANDLAEARLLQRQMRRPWRVQPCSARTGDGLIEGIEWLAQTISGKAHGEASAAPSAAAPAAAASTRSAERLNAFLCVCSAE
jgi:signal recognition particle receptor subunit beta